MNLYETLAPEEAPILSTLAAFESDQRASIEERHSSKYYNPSPPSTAPDANQNSQSQDSFDFIKTKQILHKPGFQTPSSENGLSYYDELQIRTFACKIIKQAGIILKTPNQTILNAQAIFQRVYFRRSFYELDFKIVAMGCLYLATKCEDTPKHIRRVIQYFYFVVMLSEVGPKNVKPIDVTSKVFAKIKENLIEMELTILFDIGYQIEKIKTYPHKILLIFLKNFKMPQSICQKAYSYANDAFLSPTVVYYPANTIAAACIYLAFRQTGEPTNKYPWWV